MEIMNNSFKKKIDYINIDMEISDDYWDYAINLMKNNDDASLRVNDNILVDKYKRIDANNGYPIENNLSKQRNFKTNLNEDNYVETNCKECGVVFKISYKYTGGYPLCYIHRDPNERFNKNKGKKNFKNNKK